MKAVIPAAGFGTRFLPFTKSVPKELIPIVDKPVIQYVVEEAVDSGIDDILMIVSAGKESICRHFNPQFELEQRLENSGKTQLLNELRRIGKGARIQYVYQQELDGLGGALRYAKSFAAGEPVAVLLGDNVTSGDRPVLSELLAVFREKQASVVAVEEVPHEKVYQYGVIDGSSSDNYVYQLRDLIENRVQGENLYDIVHYKDKTLEFAFTHIADFGETYFSFVNGQYTNDGGTHESAFKEALLRAVNEFSGKDYDAKDFRGGIVGSIAIKLQEPIFESQTKNKLGNTDVKSWIVPTVKKAVEDYLYRHTEEANLLLEKIKKNEDVRKEIQAVKKKGKEFEKKLSVRNSKLRDCKYHFGDRSGHGGETMIFLTEGDSAGGSMVQSRDPNTQAVFALKGKPFNCFGKKLETVYTVEELFCIMRTLDIEEDIENLRYNKVVIATDADVDGLHIRNLLITFFLSYFERLVQTGHLYILETPLFRVRPKGRKDSPRPVRKSTAKKKDAKAAAEPELKPGEQTYYCYSEEERDEKAALIGRNAEITRFKGLGEISPKEFRQFIDENIRLEQVTIDQTKGIQEMLRFYMGDNTTERWEFIQNNLV